MTDLERLDEALEAVASGGSHLDLSDIKALRVIVHFAIDTRHLLANGQRVEWCEFHASSTRVDADWCHRADVEEWIYTERNGPKPDPCRVVSRLLVDPPKEEERRMRTVTVTAGPYATVRAIERAKRLFRETVVVGGIVGSTTGRTYTYEVSDPPKEEER